jgi:peroxiredoxin
MVALVAALLLAALPAETDPRRELEAAAKACRAVGSLTCRAAHTYRAGDMEERTDRARLSFQRLAGDQKLGGRVRIDFGHPDTVVTYAWDGRCLRIASHGSKRITIRRPDDDPALPLTNSIAGRIVTENPLLRPAGIANALGEGTTITAVGTAEVGRVTCDEIRVAWPDGPEVVDRATTFYVARSDRLPRRVDTKYRFPDRKLPDEYSLTITDLEVGPALDDATFTLPAPEGYSEELFRPTARPEPLARGTRAPDFSLADAAGKTRSLADHRGRWLLLDFWGTWCGPCLRALPALQALHEELRDVDVVGVSCNEPKNADPVGLFREKRLTYTLLLDGGRTAAAYHVSAFPTIVLVDPDGNVADQHVGSSADLAAELRAMIRKHAKPGR